MILFLKQRINTFFAHAVLQLDFAAHLFREGCQTGKNIRAEAVFRRKDG